MAKMVNREKTKVASPTIKLVPISPERVPDYLRWFNDPEVRKFLNPETPRSKEDIEKWLKEITFNSSHLYFSIVSFETNRPVGHVGLKGLSEPQESVEIGIVIGEKELWRKGYGEQALKQIIKLGFEDIGLKRITATVSSDNISSINLFKKIGFTERETEGSDIIFELIRDAEYTQP